MTSLMGIEPLILGSGLCDFSGPNPLRHQFIVDSRLVRKLGTLSSFASMPKMTTLPSTKEEKEGAKKQSTARKDKLMQNEEKVRKRWEENRVFEAEAPAIGGEKFFGNFPYPYMNGVLHLGHAFSLSKLEFASAFWRLCGRNVLLPMGFHCTGMPIKACADKLTREIKTFGNPPVFPDENELKVEAKSDTGSFKSTKSKAVAKTGTLKYQWQIMKSMGIPEEEISKFTDPLYWLTYFPPIAMQDLKTFGLGCDWRRSFITTEMNPYYDSFVRWQFETLRARGKVTKDLRYAIFSPLDKQPCADHDRASGEGVLPQEYVLIKMEVKPPFTGKLSALVGKRVFLAAATLRPETMYGQTNAWVLPDGDYGAFEVNETDIFVVTKRAALNMAYQRLSKVPEKPECVLELKGQDLIGLPVVSPLAFNPVVYVLPMMNVKTDKGTGVVTSVPSDSPDDYMALHDLKSKPALRAKFGVEDEWVMPFEVIPIINIPEFGDKSAETVCSNLKIKSQNDRENLEAAKKMTYLKGFTEGKMLVGVFTGMKVQDAKPLIKKKLVESGDAVIYSEPEKPVMSRSGDECVVALTDQWYLAYGEEEWKAVAEKCLSRMETYSEEVRHGFEHTLGWLNQWACSRSFGLGTKIPWDPTYLIESLSDSTIYMAYYTVAHILQEGDLYGTGDHPVKPQQMTPDVWDYIFGSGVCPDSAIPVDILKKMKTEFDFWYPFDLRVSGKDLIQNHLTFSIYNHVTMFPEEKWPRAFRCNGMLLLNGEKMSKSTGNFLTIRDAIELYSTDATRFTLADAGDLLDDGNFMEVNANAAILRLTKEISWMEEVVSAEKELRQGDLTTFADRVFDNDINIAIHLTEKSYQKFMFKEALKTGFYDLQLARDEYRLACGSEGMNRDLIFRFMDVQTRLLTPICPHYGEHVRREVFDMDGFAVKAGWPESRAPDLTLQRANKYLKETIISFRNSLQKHLTGSKKSKQKSCGFVVAPSSVKEGFIFIADRYDGWKEECVRVLQSCFNSSTQKFSCDDKEILSALSESSMAKEFDDDLKLLQKKCMPFIRFKKDEALTVGAEALDVELPFDQMKVIVENLELVKKQIGLDRESEVIVLSISDADADATIRVPPAAAAIVQKNPPSPGSSVIVFV